MVHRTSCTAMVGVMMIDFGSKPYDWLNVMVVSQLLGVPELVATVNEPAVSVELADATTLGPVP